ncbi:hypothetical protein DBR11_20900 [Pedobacter sp. HMWF019]|uniref:hypothetical protein n=1 Tax=Pedobacter sp. HMWF019 TaxID=2056856 RepID=UPI000D3CB0D4|nr:hypothetical protein [Pedobacter sp. HMWF019]PTS95640.1 hypothetical protein DBR11_20900 [Pedobacter sp. HMWF019]
MYTTNKNTDLSYITTLVDDAESIIFQYLKASELTQQKLETFYKIIYTPGTLRQKLDLLINKNLDHQVHSKLQDLYQNYNSEAFENLSVHSRFINAMHTSVTTLAKNERIQLLDYNQQQELKEKHKAHPTAYYQVEFNITQKQLSSFKIQLEQLYNYILKLVYLSKCNFALSYFDFDTTKYTVLHKDIAIELEFAHGLQSLINNDIQKYKITFKGIKEIFKYIQSIFAQFLQPTEEWNLEELTKDPSQYFSFPLKQLSDLYLYPEGRQKLEQEFFTILTRIQTYIQNKDLTKLPKIIDIL